ncbi:NAD(P)H-dependent oxidoreductase [Cetobacterium sp. 2A]|uniref:NAD(P)H-dependent oxidoreductase n=1 Tax=Cetobacterium sp. 2A TaxID=2754723 RepID=UPI00163BAD1C|nr:NAD(P)H-dependent oxidoreductase [Cetobacterium sp. 2A]
MKITVIVTHPNIKESLVNKRWIEELKKNENITVRFLDELYPDGKIDIKKEQEYLEKSERIVFQYPFYWYNMPALMREYFDKVLEFGWAYGPNGNSLLEKEFMVAISVGAPEYSYQGGSYNNFTITELLRPMEAVSNALQMIYLPAWSIFDTPRLTNEKIEESAKKYIEYINNEDLNHRKFLEKLKKANNKASFVDL